MFNAQRICALVLVPILVAILDLGSLAFFEKQLESKIQEESRSRKIVLESTQLYSSIVKSGMSSFAGKLKNLEADSDESAKTSGDRLRQVVNEKCDLLQSLLRNQPEQEKQLRVIRKAMELIINKTEKLKNDDSVKSGDFSAMLEQLPVLAGIQKIMFKLELAVQRFTEPEIVRCENLKKEINDTLQLMFMLSISGTVTCLGLGLFTCKKLSSM